MDLYIFRHGRPVRQVIEEESEAVADPELSDLGHQQASRAADFLRNHSIHHVVSSTMQRAHQTALPTANMLGLEIERIDELKESDHASKVYVPLEEISPDDPDTAHFFDAESREDLVFSDGLDAFQDRVHRGFEHVIATNKGRRVAVFCHGMVIAVYLKTIMGVDDVFAMRADYCGLTRVQASSTGVRSVRSFNETHHVSDLIEW